MDLKKFENEKDVLLKKSSSFAAAWSVTKFTAIFAMNWVTLYGTA
jgi:hypothetical protein